MTDETTIYDYAEPVYRVLLSTDQLLGIGTIPVMAIVLITILLINLVSLWCFPVGVVLLAVAKFVCKKDPYMLTIIFNRIFLPSIWRA